MYRTGDRARILPSGDLEFLGRVDGQIKLRGFRIEPGEVEAAIRSAGVREAVVRPHEDAPGEVRLVAYFVADPSRPVSLKEIRRALKQALPLHMVPGDVIKAQSTGASVSHPTHVHLSGVKTTRSPEAKR